MANIFTIDLGGTKTAIGLLNQKAKILEKVIFPTEVKRGTKLWLNKTVKTIDNFIKFRKIKEKEILGLTIAVAGVIDRKQGILVTAPNLFGWQKIPFKKCLQKYFRFPIFLENDANIAALAECYLGTGRGSRNMIYLTVSTGIGAGIIINKKLYHGQGSAGEIGHIILDPGGPKCGCGNRGCFETLASGTAVAKLAQEKIVKNFRRGQKTLIWYLADQKIKNIKTKVVYLAARQGDSLAKEVIEETQKWLAIGLVNVIHIFHPEIIVLGGGVMRDADMILPNVNKMVKKMIMPTFQDCKIKKTKFGEDVGLIGGKVLIELKQ